MAKIMTTPTPTPTTPIETVLVLDINDLTSILRPADVQKVNQWDADLRAAQAAPRLLGVKIPDISTTFMISVNDLLQFDGTLEKVKSTEAGASCTARVIPKERVTESNSADVIITGCIAKVVNVGEAYAGLKEPVSIGSTMTGRFLDHASEVTPGLPEHKTWTAHRKKHPERLMGVFGTTRSTSRLLVVPPPTPEALCECEDWALLTYESVREKSATLPRVDDKEPFVILPERHGLVMVLKLCMLSCVKDIHLMSAANHTKGESSFVVIHKSLFAALVNRALARSKEVAVCSKISDQEMFVVYKYNEEVWRHTDERKFLGELPEEQRQQKHPIEISYTIEAYKVAPGGLWHAKAGLEGCWPPGVPILDPVNAIKERDISKVVAVPNAKLNEFYKEKSAERAAIKNLSKDFTRSYLRAVVYGEQQKK